MLAALAPALLAIALPARAQSDAIVYDGSIGATTPGQSATFFDPFYVITDAEGAFSGTNLFYSFDRFGVPDGKTAFFFDSTNSSQAVIARVTGADPSEVFGTIDLGTSRPQADFFLLNPQGIFIGPNASINVGGDTYLTSADRLRWGPDGGTFFDAHGAAAGSVLSPMDPVTFGFLSQNPAPVAVYGVDLPLSSNTTLGLAGGVVELVDTKITKASGNIELAAVRGGASELLLPVDFAELDVAGGGLGPVRLGFSELLGDASLPAATALILAGLPKNGAGLPTAPATLDVSPGGSLDPGSVVIRGERFAMRGGAILDQANAASPVPGAADFAVDVAVSDAIQLEQSARIVVENVTGSPTGGAISLASQTLSVESDARVVAQNTGAAAGGAINVAAGQQVTVRDGGQIFSQAVGSASARGGDVTVVVAAEDGEIRVEGAKPPAPGVPLAEPRVSQISALTASTNAGGDGGVLHLAAAQVGVLDGAQLRTSTLGAGDAGALDVIAGTLHVAGVADVGTATPARAGLFALTAGSGAGGELGLHADTIVVENGARVSASSQSGAAAGNLKITADTLSVRGGPDGAAIVLVEAQAAGDAGNLEVMADRIELVDGGVLSALTTASGDAGDVQLTAREILISGVGTGIFAKNEGGPAAGDAGSVRIEAADSLRVENGSEISVTSLEFGVAGNVRITGGANVVLADGARISASLDGDIRDPVVPDEDLTADVQIEDVASLTLSDATITTATAGNGQGGDILVRTSGPIVLERGSRLTARSLSTQTDAGNAGRIDLDAGTQVAVLEGSRIETSTVGAASGGAIRLAAGELVYLSDAVLSTDVNPPEIGVGDPVDGGDVVIQQPGFAVLNRSSIVARARGSADAGNILIDATDGFFPSAPLLDSIDPPVAGASVLDATAGPAGIPGTIVITSPSADLVSQVTPLPTDYLDATALLTTPCEARRARRGSLTVQTRATFDPPPDALFGLVASGAERTDLRGGAEPERTCNAG